VETTSRIGFSPFDGLRSESVLNLAHYSPVTHGMCQIDVTFSDDVIKQATPVLGAMHRGAEKLFESRDYRQVIGLANRHEWLSAFSGEVGIAQLIEREIGIDVPLHARWLRTLILEINRITSHLAFLSGFPWVDGTTALELRELREVWVNHMRTYTGSRMHPMLTQIGGMTHAPKRQWLEQLDDLTRQTQETLSALERAIEQELTRYVGVGIITTDQVAKSAITGPVARASGAAIDLRARSTNLMYQEITDFQSVTNSSSDIPARIEQLRSEIAISCKVVKACLGQCLARNGDDVNVLIPKVLRVPEGEYEQSIETPLGIASWYLVSQGDKYPYRLKLRPASLHTILALPAALIGNSRHMIEPIVASMPFLTGDAER
jgi:NADH-quinone oxidoreductase subunit D